MDNKIINFLEKFKEQHILVIGDIMLDKYIFGNVERISPEAPVQIVNVRKENYVPGGAANTANNISSLGAKASLIGIVGKDNANQILMKELDKRNINCQGIVTDDKKPTIQKIRVLGQNQQLLRIDYEIKEYVTKETEDKIIDYIKTKISEINAIIISDYIKGIVTKSLFERITDLTNKNNKIIIVDPKPKHKEFYKNVTLITPNHKEACEMLNQEINNNEDLKEIGIQLLKDLNTNILITRGEKGMCLFEKDENITHIPTAAKEVYDVSGAGDTVIATITLALASGATPKEAAIVANHAAGIVVGKLGTATATIEEIRKSLENE